MNTGYLQVGLKIKAYYQRYVNVQTLQLILLTV